MAQSIILKRSALQGKVPTTSSLSLGEIAINTYDGKLYLNRSGSIQSIQEIITTNVVNTGSITLTQTGSFGELVVSQDGNFQRDLYVTRDVITNGSLDILYDVSASVFLGAIRATNGVISGSSQITSLGFISSSQTINTGSLATTGSNSFKADQQITGSLGVSGDITVLGSVNARQFNIGIISSSVLYTSGSTKFGDTGDDIMSVTGSLQVSGSLTVTGSVTAANGFTGSLFGTASNLSNSATIRTSTAGGHGFGILTPDTTIYLTVGINGGNAIASSGNVSGIRTIPTQTGTGGVVGIYSNPILSGTLPNSSSLTSIQAGVRAANASASYGRALEVISPTINGTSSININTGLYINAQSASGVTTGYGIYQSSSLDLNYFAGNLGLGPNKMFPTAQLDISGSAIITGSLVVTNGITGSLFGTASYALNGSSNAIMYQTASAASTWVFNHFLATPYPVVTVYDNNNSVIIPQSIVSNDSSSLTITFSSARTGVAVASKGGYVGSSVGTATVANALTTARLINGTSFDGTQNITIPNLVSGSTQISLAGTSDYGNLFGGIASATASLNTYTGSVSDPKFGILSVVSGALNQFTASINGWSGSIATTGSNSFRGTQQITGSLSVSAAITGSNGKFTTGISAGQLSTPTISTISASSAGGTIPAGTYYYKVAALDYNGTQTPGSSEVSTTVTGSTSNIFLSWSLIQGASSYRVYRSTTSNTYGSYVAVNNGVNGTFTDTNQAVTSGSIATLNDTGYGFFDASKLRTNNITLVNNGIGQLATITFEKSTDGAAINVAEYSSDSTMFEFKTTDNPDGTGDFFHWFTGDYQNPSSGWKPLKLTNFTNQFVAQNTNFWSSFNLPSNTGYYTTNADTLANATIKADPYTSNSYSLLKDSGTGTGILNVEISGFTGTSMRTYWISIASSTTFDWGINSQTYGTTLGTGVIITGAFQTLDNGLQIKLSAGGHVAGDRWAFRAFPTPKFVIGKSTTGNAPFDLLGNGLITGSLGITGSLVVTGSIIATNGITGSIAATNGVVSGSSQVIGILSSLNTYTGSNDTKFSTLATLTGSIETKFTSIGASTSSLNTYTASTDTRFSALQASTASLNVYTQSNDTVNTTQNNRLTALETATGSNTVVSQSIFFINNYTGSAFLSQSVVNARLTALEIASASLEVFTSSQNTKNLTLATYTGSNDTKWSNLAIYTASVDTKFGAIQSTTNSLNLFTSSILTALTASGVNLTANGNLTVQGNLTIAGTQTIINSTTVQLGDNIIELNGSSVANGGIFVKDPTAPTTGTGSFLWDSTNDFWRAGLSGSESRILVVGSMGVVSGSSQISIAGTSDYSSLFGGIASATASLNLFTSSAALRLTNLETTSASVNISLSNLNSFSASENTKASTLSTYTGSIDTKFTAVAASTASLNLFTSSVALRLTNLESTSASVNISVSNINTYTASVSNSIQQLSLKTGSYATTGSNAFIGNQTISGSLTIGSASVATENTLLVGPAPAGGNGEGGQILLAASGGLYTSASMFDTYQNRFRVLRGTNAASDAEFLNINLSTGQLGLNKYTGSGAFPGASTGYLAVDNAGNVITVTPSSTDLTQLNSFSASAAIRLTNLETTTASLNISVTNLNSYSASVSNSILNLNAFSASNANTSLNTYTGSISDPKFVQIGASTSSLNGFTSSAALRLTNLETTSASVNISVSNLNTYSASVSNSIQQLNTFTASAAIRLTNLETTSASVNISVSNLNTYSASVSNSIQQLSTFTASNANTSLNTYTGSVSDPKFIQIGASTSSLNAFTSSAALRLTNLESTSASVNISVSNLNTYSASVSNSIQQLNTFTASIAPRLTNLETTSASVNISVSNINSYTASVSNSIQQLSSKTGSYATTGSNSFNGNQIITGSLTVTSLTTIATSLTTNSSSFVLTSGSNLIIQNAGLAEITGSLRVSGSTTITGSVSVSGSVTATSFTGSLLGTASYALNGSSNAFLYQTSSAASVWTFNHYLQTRYPIIQIYDNTDSVIIPQSITAVDTNTTTITFSSARTGTAVASKGGYVGSVVASATIASSSVSASVATTASYAISASAAATTFSIGASSTTYGSYINTIQGANTIISTPTGSYSGAFYKYVATSGSNARAGEVMAIWNNTTTQFTDVTTNDIGSTTMVTSSVALSAGSAVLSFTTNTNGWNIKTFVTYL